MIEAQHRFLHIARLVCQQAIDLFVMEDVFKKNAKDGVFFFKCEEGTETENVKSSE